MSDTKLSLATWESRFWAWLIDVIVVGAVLELFDGAIAGLPTVFSVDLTTVGGLGLTLGTNGVALFAYWTLSEGIWGQSAGKAVMNLRLTDRRGDHPSFLAAAGQAFGKAFFLPIDCLVGWLAMSGTKLRLTNRLTDTLVLSVPAEELEGIEYVIPEE
ncbi:RDD family protein [Haloarchaeobius sp. DFWS5]|uniref:RDD family protein n=1 Tax=Haloarchaeobius sp. DFWS5 TaxID=3446114 RepID=UPI003EBBB4BD